MKINVSPDGIYIRASSINPENRIDTEANIVTYKERVYLSTPTNRYWIDSARGNVIELRNIEGKKLHSVGKKEVIGWGTPVYWSTFEADGRIVPKKVKEFYYKLEKRWR